MKPITISGRSLFLLFVAMALATIETFGQRVYWTQGTQIRSANLDGSMVITHYTHPDQPHKISIDHTNNIAFFLTLPGQGDLYRIPLSTFTGPTLIYSWGAMTAGLNIAHHPGDANVYISSFVDSDPGLIEYSAYTDQDCCQFPTTLNIGSYSGDVFHDIKIDTDGENVYVSNEFDGVIYSVGTFGGPLTTVIPSGAGEAFDFDFGANEIIYENPTNDQILAADKDSGTGGYTKISSGLSDIKAIAVHPDGRLIILDANTIKTANSDGSNLFQILTGLTGATDLSLSECSDPTIQASAVSANSTTPTSIDLSWTNGNGDEVLVVGKQGTAVSSGPRDGILHAHSSVFGSGDHLGLSNYVIYRGTGNSVSVTNLDPSTTYHFAVYSLNTFGACYRTPGATASTTTLAPPSPQNVSSALTDDSYPAGSTISVEVTFDQAVDVGGTPRILLETGTTDRHATYVGGSGTTTLTFQYVVQAGDESTDLEYVSASALGLNGGTIVAASDNTTATLTLPTPGTAGSLGTNKDIIIDGVLPTVSSIAASPNPVTDADAGTGTFTLAIVFIENMDASVSPSITFPTEDPSATLTFNSGSWSSGTTYEAVYDVADAEEIIADIDIVITSARDLAGNIMNPHSQADVFSIDMCTLPVITLQPTDKTTCANIATGFSVTATGTSLTYQWEMDDGAGGVFNAISDGSQFQNTTTDQVDILDPSALDGYRFQCVITESGNCSTTSNIVTLNVDPLPSTSNAGANDAVCGTSYTLSATTPAIGTGTWSVVSVPGGSPGVTFSDVTANNATVDLNTSFVYGAYEFQWEVTSGICASSISTVQITFSEAGTSNAGTDFTACGSTDFALSGTIGGSATSGHWRVVTGAGTLTSSGSATGSSISGPAINDSYTPGTADYGTTVSFELIAEDPDGAGACIDVVSPLNVNIIEPPVIVPQTVTVCSGTNTGVTLSASPGTISSYEIVDIVADAGLNAATGNVTVGSGYSSGAIQNDVFTNTTTGTLVVRYDIRATASGPPACVGPVQTITVNINPQPVVDPNLSTSACSNTPTGLVLSTAPGSVAAGGGYHLINVAIPGGVTANAGNATIDSGLPANALSNDSFSNGTLSSQVVQYTVAPISTNGCEGDAVVINVTIDPAPQMNTALSTVSACTGSPLGVTLSTAGTSISASNYDITGISVDATLTPGGSNATIGTGKASSAIANDVFTNSSSSIASVVYTVEPVGANGCHGDPFVITAQISPANTGAIATPATQTICSGETTAISLSGADSYSWTVTAPSGISGASSGNGNTIAQTLQNNNTSTATVTYTITPVENGCAGNSFTATIAVNPLPQVFQLSGGGNICTGETASITLSGSQTGTTYTLLRNGSTVVETMTGTAGAINFTAQSAAGNYTVQAENSSTSCISNMTGTATITVSTPPSAAVLSGSTAICQGSAAQLTLNITGGTAPYTIDIQNLGVINFTGAPISVSPTVTTNYSLNSVVDANNCNATSIDNTVVTVQVDNPPTTATVGADVEVCDATFANLGGNNPSVGTGQWSVVSGTGSINNINSPNSGVTGLGLGVNVFQWTISNGTCSSSSATITITRNEGPSGRGIVSSGTGGARFCQNDQNITFSVSGISNATSYIWSLPAGVIPVSGTVETSSPSITVNLNNAQSGPVEVIGKNMCGSSPVSSPLNIIILANPDVTIVNEPEIISGRTTTFNIEGGTDITQVLWQFGDGGSSSELSPEHTYSTPGGYTVVLELVNDQGCSSSIEKPITVNGLEPISINSIKNAITPNGDGANDHLIIENIENYPDNTVTVLDRWGVEIIRLEGYKNDWDLAVGGKIIPAGNYLCIVQIREGDNTERKVVTRTITVVKGNVE
ncbi:hypothetical protein C900_00773 [Fulvivirga imtechensis AK7]|uniref:PKD domain-containing protein n=1 Tax=Fulvivirga imtechensis AK7 TaxID=1237149 RepID=L8K021_9BACT|nr:PKD-like domain-containing protein [Fulvivirga imtechensis]ELR72812.1 hypothetical protein C900_00773 [Fulvivirga imtechensis AK7]